MTPEPPEPEPRPASQLHGHVARLPIVLCFTVVPCWSGESESVLNPVPDPVLWVAVSDQRTVYVLSSTRRNPMSEITNVVK